MKNQIPLLLVLSIIAHSRSLGAIVLAPDGLDFSESGTGGPKIFTSSSNTSTYEVLNFDAGEFLFADHTDPLNPTTVAFISPLGTVINSPTTIHAATTINGLVTVAGGLNVMGFRW